MLAEYCPVVFEPGTVCRARGPLPIQSGPIYHLQRHNCMEIGYCHSGHAVYIVEGQILELAAGDLTFIPPDVAHFGSSANAQPSLWSWIFADVSALVLATGLDRAEGTLNLLHAGRLPVRVSSREQACIGRWTLDLLAELASPGPHAQTVARGLLLAILSRWAGLRASEQADDPLPEPGTSREKLLRIQPAIEHLTRHFAKQTSVPHLASLCCTSPANLWRLFRRSLGMSPQQYVQLVRVQAATRELLYGELDVACIARMVGFPTVSSFNRTFRKLTGLTPRDWRTRQARGPAQVSGASATSRAGDRVRAARR